MALMFCQLLDDETQPNTRSHARTHTRTHTARNEGNRLGGQARGGCGREDMYITQSGGRHIPADSTAATPAECGLDQQPAEKGWPGTLVPSALVAASDAQGVDGGGGPPSLPAVCFKPWSRSSRPPWLFCSYFYRSGPLYPPSPHQSTNHGAGPLVGPRR
ncbi:hypothetical protein VTK26DRAFT_2119 [Humicola hyalothermophila]